MQIYATPADLKDWLGADEPPADAAARLRSASILARDATLAAIYEADSDGLPTDPDLLSAFRDCCCSQAAMWLAAGIDPSAQGAAISAPTISSKSMGGRSVSYTDPATYAAVQQTRAAAARELCPEALGILREAGLLSGQPGVPRA